MDKFQLTRFQQLSVDSFRGFLVESEQVFMLKGAAGTGKTTLISEYLKILEERNRPFRLMAPTGRAAYIIGLKTGFPAFTIHKTIYSLSTLESSVEEDGGDFDSLQARFCLKMNEDDSEMVYIIDESSMISDAFSENEAFSFGSGQLLTDLFRYANGRKLVFIGDYAQLPPVGMNFSPALDKDYLEQKFDCEVLENTLREVIRQANGSMILSNASRLRNSIESKTFIEFKMDEGSDSIAENDDLINSYYKLSGTKPSVSSTIITYSNRQAHEYNVSIRRHYYGDHVSRLVRGDLLMVVRNNYAYDIELFNGNIVQVESCVSDSDVEVRNVRVKIGKGQTESVELRFRKATIRFMAGGTPVSLNVLLLDNFLEEPSGSINRLLAQGLIVDFNNRLNSKIKEHLPEIKRSLRAKGKLSRELQEIHDSYLRLLKTDPYYNAVLCKYGYAVTCHKAQGGEWDNVFVDMCRYGGTANEAYFRWAYTAITRASKKLWYYRSPEFNYISNIVVEPIQLSSKVKVSIYSSDSDFCEDRYNRVKQLCDNVGLSVGEDKSRSYQHWLIFSDGQNATATYVLWYTTSGYNGKYVLRNSSSESFAGICKSIVDASFTSGMVPFVSPGRPFAEKLVSFVKSLLKELDIQLLDITQESYQDIFHLKTDGLAKVSFYYTDKGNYTYMRLVSSLGAADSKLEALRRSFM